MCIGMANGGKTIDHIADDGKKVEEVIKALECCVTDDYDESCIKCPMLKHKPCDYTLHKNALDLIKRLQEENEKLKTENQILSQKRFNIFERIEYSDKLKSKAIKEYKEKLKEHAYLDSGITGFQEMVVDLSDIENIAEEMVGEGK